MNTKNHNAKNIQKNDIANDFIKTMIMESPEFRASFWLIMEAMTKKFKHAPRGKRVYELNDEQLKKLEKLFKKPLLNFKKNIIKESINQARCEEDFISFGDYLEKIATNAEHQTVNYFKNYFNFFNSGIDVLPDASIKSYFSSSYGINNHIFESLLDELQFMKDIVERFNLTPSLFVDSRSRSYKLTKNKKFKKK